MAEIDETELIGALRTGSVVDGGADGVRTVPAALLRQCCHELGDQVDPRGMRLSKVVVTGGLDLAGLTVPFPLRFDSCEFDTAPVLEGARLYELSMTGCLRLPGLFGNGLSVRRDLDLSRSQVAGALWTSASTSRSAAIWLCEADIGGRAALRGHRARRPGLPGDAGGPDPRGRGRPADPGVPVIRRSQVHRSPDRRLAGLHGRADRVVGWAGPRPRGRGHRRERVPDRRPGRAEAGNPGPVHHGQRSAGRPVHHPQRHHPGRCGQPDRQHLRAADVGRHRAGCAPAVGGRRNGAGRAVRGDRAHRHGDERREQRVDRRELRAARAGPHRPGPDQRADPRPAPAG